MTRDAWAIVHAGAIFCAALAASYGFARLGEPQSAWLWCAILGACP